MAGIDRIIAGAEGRRLDYRSLTQCSEKKITNPLYGKFEEVVDALVEEKAAPEDESPVRGVREGSRGYRKKKRRKRS